MSRKQPKPSPPPKRRSPPPPVPFVQALRVIKVDPETFKEMDRREPPLPIMVDWVDDD